MVRSMPFRDGRPLSPTAPTRRQLQLKTSKSSSSSQSSKSDKSPLSSRTASIERRRALTSVGKAALIAQGNLGPGRVRTGQDSRRSVPDQPVWVRRDQKQSGEPRNQWSRSTNSSSNRSIPKGSHPLTDQLANDHLRAYELEVKGRFERIVPLLQKVSALQHGSDFIDQAQQLACRELGFDLPTHILERAWVTPLDMRALYAWCVFESHRVFSDHFFQDDPLASSAESEAAKSFEQFLLDCGFHLLDVTLARMGGWLIPSPMHCVFHLALYDVAPMLERCLMSRTRLIDGSKLSIIGIGNQSPMLPAKTRVISR